MRKAAKANKEDIKAHLPQIAYADMHCDSVTACCGEGARLASFSGQVSGQKLLSSGCAVQCFAIFTEGKNSAADFEKYTAFYFDEIRRGKFYPVFRAADVLAARARGKTGAVLTVENLGFLGGDVSGIFRLATMGVKMASLRWNNPNAFAAERLTPSGKDAVVALNQSRMIVDISHLPDGAAEEVLDISLQPVVASHSDCRAVCNVARNLPDELIGRIADSGGIVGLNFSRNFLGEGSAVQNFIAHFWRLLNVGGEDVLALGSDFDGIVPYAEIADCTYVPEVFRAVLQSGVPERIVEKFALGNFMRVFEQVVG